jgi:hypothetical protein
MDLMAYFNTSEWHTWFNTALIALVASFLAPSGNTVRPFLVAVAVFALGGAALTYRTDTDPVVEEVSDGG